MRSALALSSCVALLSLSESARAEPPPHEWSPADEELRAPHHVRSFIEMGSGLALGTGGYWLLKNKNLVDWDNPGSLGRFDGSAWVLDNNSIGVNFLGHPLMGGLAHNLSRGNHQSVAGAFGYSFLTSFIWEFAIEYKEKVSINDVLVTPGTGLPLGEFFHKLGLYLDSGHHDSFVMDSVRAVLGGGVALDRALDDRPPPRVTRRDDLGFSSAIWHAFEARYGTSEITSASRASYARFYAGMAGKLVTLPGYGAPGRWARAFYAAEVSSLALTAESSRYGWGLALSADTALVGYHAQSFERSPGGLRGHSLTVGSSLSYDYLRSSANRYASVERALDLAEPALAYHAPNRREQYGALQLPGVSAELRVLRQWGAVESSLRIQPSFAGLGAPAFYEWTSENPAERSKHILHRQGYFYGWGGAGNLTLRGRLGPLRAGLDVLYATYVAQDGLDRHADELTVDVRATGDVLFYRAGLGVAPRADCVISLELGGRRFRSRVGGHELTASSVERGVSARVSF